MSLRRYETAILRVSRGILRNPWLMSLMMTKCQLLLVVLCVNADERLQEVL